MKLFYTTLSIAAALLLVVLMGNEANTAKVKFTNLNCKVFDNTIVTMKRCSLKALNRDTVKMNLNAELHKTPIDNITLNAALFQKTNGYRHVIFNTSGDVCKFLRHPERAILWNLIYMEQKQFSNVNHTCPIDHDIILKDMVVSENVLRLIPFPANEYMLLLIFGAYNRKVVELRIYVAVSN